MSNSMPFAAASYINQKLFFDKFENDLRVQEAKRYGVIIHSSKQPTRKDFEEAYYRQYKLSAPIVPGVRCVWVSLKTYMVRSYTTLYDLGEQISSGNLYRWFGEPEASAFQHITSYTNETSETKHMPDLAKLVIPIINNLNSKRLVNLYIIQSSIRNTNLKLMPQGGDYTSATTSPYDTPSSNLDFIGMNDDSGRDRGNAVTARILVDPTPTLSYSSAYNIPPENPVTGGSLFGDSPAAQPIFWLNTARGSLYMTIYNFAGFFTSIPLLSWTVLSALSTSSSASHRHISRISGLSAPNGAIAGVPTLLGKAKSILLGVGWFGSMDHTQATLIYGLYANNDSWDYIGDSDV